jgi:ornithine decarboxylase
MEAVCAACAETVATNETLATPYFSIDRQRLLDNVTSLRSHLSGVELHYAMKANPEPDVLEAVAGAGVGFEIASIHELDLLGDVAGSGTVIFGTAVKPAAHIERAFERGVGVFAADSINELDKIATRAPGAEVFIRLRVNDSGSVFAFGEKFGAEPGQAVRLVIHAARRGLRPLGFSFHVGSQATRAEAWSDALMALRPLIDDLARAGIELSAVNIGGGFPCQYAGTTEVPSLAEIGALIATARHQLPELRMLAEPGRFIAATAATLTTSVIARIDRGGSPWLFLDAGCYNGLFEAMTYQGNTRYIVTDLSEPSHLGVRRRTFNLAGPTGDSADVIARNVWLPDHVGVNSRLVVHDVGAYTMSMSVPFNGFPKPQVRLG